MDSPRITSVFAGGCKQWAKWATYMWLKVKGDVFSRSRRVSLRSFCKMMLLILISLSFGGISTYGTAFNVCGCFSPSEINFSSRLKELKKLKNLLLQSVLLNHLNIIVYIYRNGTPSVVMCYVSVFYSVLFFQLFFFQSCYKTRLWFVSFYAKVLFPTTVT